MSAFGLSPEELYRRGSRSFGDRDYKAARGYLERYVELRPGDASAFHLLARTCILQDTEFARAEECLRQALELDPAGETTYLETLGTLYMRRSLFARAEETFAYALSIDRKLDQKHTGVLEYYHGLARKKAEDAGTDGTDEEGRPDFLRTELDRWDMRRRQALFVLPSVVTHIILFLVMGFLFTHDLRVEDTFKEDFTYVDVGAGEEPMPDETEAQATAPQAAEAESRPSRSGTGQARDVKTASMEKGGSAVSPGQARLGESGAGPERAQVGEKASGDIGQDGGPEDIAAQAMGGEKGLDVASAPRSSTHGISGDVDLLKRSLGGAAGGGAASAGGGRAADVGGISERGGSSAPAQSGDGDGIFMGGDKGSRGKGFSKGRGSLKGGDAPSQGGGPAGLAGGGEKGLDVGSSGARSLKGQGIEAGDLMARGLGIDTGGSRSSATGRSGGGAGSLRSVDRGEGVAADGGAGGLAGVGAESGARGGIGGGKQRGSISAGGAGGPGSVRALGGGERGIDIPAGGAGGGRKGLADAAPSIRGLDMGAGGASGGKGAGRTGGVSLAGIEGRGKGAAPATPGAGTAASGADGSGAGYSPGSLTGKRSGGTLGGPGAGKGKGESGGLFAGLSKKVSDFLGGGGRGGGAGDAGAGDMRVGDLSGLAPAGGSGSDKGQGGGGAGGKGAGGVRLGSGEKARVIAPGSGGSGSGLSGGGRAADADGKRMAAGALGVPGGAGDERYASAGRVKGRQQEGDKQAALSGGRGLAKPSEGPVVSIVTPAPGDTKSLSQVVTGTVSNWAARKATLTVNNDSRVISVERGNFEAVVSLRKGRNVITVMAFDLHGNVGKDMVTVDYVEPTAGSPVNILSPRDGQVFDVSERSVVTVKGTIGDQDIKRAKLIFNGNPMDIIVDRGYFEQKVALVEEKNTLLVEAVTADGEVSRSGMVTVNTMNARPKDVMVILGWDKPHADMDLHIYGPLGGHTFYKNPNIYESREAIAGAQPEQDAKGNFGPEVFTQERTDKGTYTIKSNYYYSGGDGNSNATVTVILYGDNPSRRIVRVFGPHLQVDTKTGEDTWEVTKFKMPEGIFLED
ncbi:MAG: hypothetical protein HZC51_09505 [Nitrospirae bacterium]|nr:hypothetical protein [Nitrospirota bacterium]